MERTFEFDVLRDGRIVRVDLTAADDITEADADAVVDAVDELLAHPDVDAVRLSGAALRQGTPPDGLNRAIRALGTLAKQHGKEFIVGPI